MLFMRGDVEVIARQQMHQPIVRLKTKSCLALEQQHPFGLILVIPEARWRTMALRNDALDA